MSLVTRGLGRGLGAVLVTAGLGLAPVDTGVVHARATQTLQSIASTAQVEARVAAAADHSYLEISQSAQSIAVDQAQAAQQVEQVSQNATALGTFGAFSSDTTLDPPSQSGQAAAVDSAQADQALGAVEQAATFGALDSVVQAAQVDPITQQAELLGTFGGFSSTTALDLPSQSAQAQAVDQAQASQTLGAIEYLATAQAVDSVVQSAQIDQVAQSAQAVAVPSGATQDATLDPPTQVAQAAGLIQAQSVQTLALGQQAAAQAIDKAVQGATLPALAQDATGLVVPSGVQADQALPEIAQVSLAKAVVAVLNGSTFDLPVNSGQSAVVDRASSSQSIGLFDNQWAIGPVDRLTASTAIPLPEQSAQSIALVSLAHQVSLPDFGQTAEATTYPSGYANAVFGPFTGDAQATVLVVIDSTSEFGQFVGQGWGFHVDSGIVGEGWLIAVNDRLLPVRSDLRTLVAGPDTRVDRVPADLRVDRIPAKPEPVYTEFRMKELRVGSEPRVLPSLFETRRLRVPLEVRKTKVPLVIPATPASEPETMYID